MTIKPFSGDDVKTFLKLAALENWLSDEREMEFLLSEFPQGCLTATKNDEAAGYVTSLLHERSGWIGNLIVDAKFRGQGIGEALFKKTLDTLQTAGAGTVWLTASAEGKSLYEKYGFKTIDTIIRWNGTGRQRHPGHDRPAEITDMVESVKEMDRLTWGDKREALLEETMTRGKLLYEKSGFLLIQPCGDTRQFGPFTALESATAEHLLDNALGTIETGTKIYLDTPASNRTALRLFNRRRLRISGTTELMYAGNRPDYRPERLYGLATMGSCG